MDYGNLLTKAFDVIWKNKFLIVLGILVALGSGRSGSPNFNFGNNANFNQPAGTFPTPAPGGQGNLPQGIPPQLEQQFQQLAPLLGLGVGILIVLLCVAVIVGIALSVIARIASGALINGVDQIESGEGSSFSKAWSAGWRKGWTLIILGLIPAIPVILGLLVFIVYFVAAFSGGRGADLFRDSRTFGDAQAQQLVTLFGVFFACFCPSLLVSLILSFIVLFADRAAMLENLGWREAFGRGWEVLRTHLGEAIILGVIQIVLNIGIGIVLLIPSFIAAICCFLWPLFYIIGGFIAAYFSTAWTLAWREWVPRRTGEIAAPLPSTPQV